MPLKKRNLLTRVVQEAKSAYFLLPYFDRSCHLFFLSLGSGAAVARGAVCAGERGGGVLGVFGDGGATPKAEWEGMVGLCAAASPGLGVCAATPVGRHRRVGLARGRCGDGTGPGVGHGVGAWDGYPMGGVPGGGGVACDRCPVVGA